MPLASPSNKPNNKNLYQLAERSHWQFPTPKSFSRLLANGTIRSTSEIDTLVGTDMPFRARLLMWCNSRCFNWSSPFPSLREAAIVIGEEWMPRLAILLEVRESFLPDLAIKPYSRKALWQHGIAVGTVAALVARICNIEKQEDAFLAGAMHDFGLLALESLEPLAFERLLSKIDRFTPETNIELECFGVRHSDIAGLIMGQWGLPKRIVKIVRYQSRTSEQIETLEKRDAQLTRCVSIANYLCSRTGHTSLGIHNIAPPGNEVFASLGIDSERLRIIWDHIHYSIETADEIA